jgi:hypothetical protein
MGADFIYAMAIVPNEDEAKEVLRRIDALTIDTCPELPSLDDSDSSPEDYVEEVKEYLRGCLEQLMETVDRRDADGFTIGDRFVILTGGMSWGDNPTELCQPIWDLENAGVLYPTWDDFDFTRKVTPEKIDAARTHLDKITGA